MPTPDETDRDKFYSSSADDDSEEYEVEPPDAEVLAAEKRRATQEIEDLQMSVDINEIYREADRRDGGEILEGWVRDLRGGFRFQVKHLLFATAVLAIALTLWRLDLLGTALVLTVMISIAGVYLYVLWKEKQQQDEADRRRQEMYARQRAHFEKMNRKGSRGEVDTAAEGEPVQASLPLPSEADQVWQEAMAREEFRFRFSLRELLLAMMAAAVILGLVRVLGGPANTATMLGFVALSGLVVHALGVEPPESIILGWWLILVLYVLLSILSVVWSGFA